MKFIAMKKYIYKTVVFFFVLLFTGCGIQNEVVYSGKTMGTVYHIKIVTGFSHNTEGLKQKIDMKLEEINNSMSTYRKNSEISRFNALGRIGEKFYVSVNESLRMDSLRVAVFNDLENVDIFGVFLSMMWDLPRGLQQNV